MHPVPTPEPVRRYRTDPPPHRPTVDLTMGPVTVPDGAWGLLVTAVSPAPGRVLDGQWLLDPDWSQRHDQDVVATIGSCRTHHSGRDGVHLEAYLVHDGRVLRLGSWCHLGAGWPETLRHPASSAMTLHNDLLATGHQCADRITG
jgi:hypothetical protein